MTNMYMGYDIEWKMQDINDKMELRSELLANITSQMENFSTKDVSLASLVIEDLTKEAIVCCKLKSR